MGGRPEKRTPGDSQWGISLWGTTCLRGQSRRKQAPAEIPDAGNVILMGIASRSTLLEGCLAWFSHRGTIPNASSDRNVPTVRIYITCISRTLCRTSFELGEHLFFIHALSPQACPTTYNRYNLRCSRPMKTRDQWRLLCIVNVFNF